MKRISKLIPIRVLENWELYSITSNEFLVKCPNGFIELFTAKADAERFMLYEFYNQMNRPYKRFNKCKPVKKQRKDAFHANMETMTNRRIESMRIFDSEGYIRLLQDPSTGCYVVFNGRFNQSHYSRSYQSAEKFFNNLIAKS